VENQHSYKGFNLLADEDAAILRTLLRGEFAISGLTHRRFHPFFIEKSDGQISRLLKRLHVQGLVKKVGNRYKYHLTQTGRQAATMALKLREMYVIPTLAYSQPV